jgi:hypothetical protein
VGNTQRVTRRCVCVASFWDLLIDVIEVTQPRALLLWRVQIGCTALTSTPHSSSTSTRAHVRSVTPTLLHTQRTGAHERVSWCSACLRVLHAQRMM